MIVEGAELNVDEEIVLNKFEGDLSDEEMANADPIETVVIKNGKIVEHIYHERKEVTN